jgi:hypothetical protein
VQAVNLTSLVVVAAVAVAAELLNREHRRM